MTVPSTEPIQTTNRLLAVLDSVADARAATARLVEAGIASQDIDVLHGDEGAARFARPGRSRGAWRATMRLLSFMAVDQAVDLRWYEAAIAEGRAVAVVRAPTAAERAAAVAVLREAGAHFMNHYGRFATEDIAAWRGPPPAIPWTHHR